MAPDEVLDAQPARCVTHGLAEHRCAPERTEAQVLLEAREPHPEPLAEILGPEVLETGARAGRIEYCLLGHRHRRRRRDRLPLQVGEHGVRQVADADRFSAHPERLLRQKT